MSAEERMIQHVKEGRLLAYRCIKCGNLHLSTVYYCAKCGNRGSEDVILEGTGRIATYTIITVAPSGFEKYTPYAFVVMELDSADLRISGFMEGIGSPADLPVGTSARITGFDERGIIIQKR